MYERFTDSARKVMCLATDEGTRLKHDYIGTEHILLGLIRERNGVARHVFAELCVDLDRIRFDIERIVGLGPNGSPVPGRRPHTPRAMKVVMLAVDNARQSGDSFVGTEHILLGLIEEQEGVAAQVLFDCGLRRETIRSEIARIRSHSPTLSESSPYNGTNWFSRFFARVFGRPTNPPTA